MGAVATFMAIWVGALLIGAFGDDVVGPSRQVIIDAGTVWPYALIGSGLIFVLRLFRGLLKMPPESARRNRAQ